MRKVSVFILVVAFLISIGLSGTAQEQGVLAVVDFSDGFYGWRVFGSGLLEWTSEQAKSGGASLKLTGRTASWNGAALNIDPILSDGGTYRFSIYVRLESASEGALANMTVSENTKDGNTNYRWVSDQVRLSDQEWVLLESREYTYNGKDISSAFLYVEVTDPNASFYIDLFEITGDKPLRGEYAAIARANEEIVDNTKPISLLKDVYADRFLIGLATDSLGAAMPIKDHFNAITFENRLKWESVHPQPDQYRFVPVDALMDFAKDNGMKVIGHTLVWHSQTPDWVFEHPDGTPLTREELLARMEDHIKTVVGRYRGQIYSWDVVNEL